MAPAPQSFVEASLIDAHVAAVAGNGSVGLGEPLHRVEPVAGKVQGLQRFRKWRICINGVAAKINSRTPEAVYVREVPR